MSVSTLCRLQNCRATQLKMRKLSNLVKPKRKEKKKPVSIDYTFKKIKKKKEKNRDDLIEGEIRKHKL